MEKSLAMRPGETTSRRSGAFYVPRFGSAVFVRLLIWLCFGGLGALTLMAARGRPAIIVIGAAMLGIALLLEWLWGRHAPLRQPLLTVDAGGVGSTAFPRKRPHLRWHEIERIAVSTARGAPVLEIVPKAAPGKRQRACRVRLGLLRKQDRALAEALITHHTNTAGIALPASVVAERAFHATMKALPKPWGLYALIAINLAIWLFTLTRGASVDAVAPAKLVEWGGNLAVLVQDGQWWRLLSAMFLHSSLKHLAGNMVVLYVLGTHVERFFGTRGFLLIYIGAGLIGSATSLHFAAQTAVSVGASGAVFGVGGALLAAVVRHRRHLPEGIHARLRTDAIVMIGYSLVQGFLATRVDNAAHVGGLLGGVLLGLCLPVRLDAATYARKLRRGMTMAALAGAAAVVTVAMLAPAVPQASRDALTVSRQIEVAHKAFMTAFRGLEADSRDIRAGKLTEQEADARSRAIHAPAFEAAVSELVRVTLPSSDPRAPMVQDMTLLADLLHEMSRMESVRDPRTGKLRPADPLRAIQINADVARLTARMNQRNKPPAKP